MAANTTADAGNAPKITTAKACIVSYPHGGKKSTILYVNFYPQGEKNIA